MNKKWMCRLTLACLFFIAAGLTGCSLESEEKEEKADDTLIIATANETPSMTTNLHNAAAGDYMNKMTHNGLFLLDENMEVQPDLVENYENVSDSEWIFRLRQGVKFHNGKEMTAEDVKASLELTKQSPEVAQYGNAYTDIEILDAYTIKIYTEGPQATLLNDLTNHGNYILPADLIKNGHDFNKEPIGTGPYKLKEWKKGESIEFEAYDDYFHGEVPIEHVIWKVIPEGSSRTMALEAGEVDLIIEVETTDVPRLKADEGIRVYDEPGTGYNYMMVNNEVEPFDNIDFRRAVSSSIDRNAVIQVALNGGGSPAYAMVPECFPGATVEGAPTYDPELAKEFFAVSGLDPAECGFSIICSDDTKLRAGQVIQNCLKETLGIDVRLESMDLATYLDRTATGDYQAALGGYTSDTMMSYAKGVFHSAAIGASNKTRLNDPEVDGVIERMLAATDAEENTTIVTEFSRKMNEICPQIPLYLKNNTRAYDADLKGFQCNASGSIFFEALHW